ncbi:hypothetical protein KFE96_13980 [Kordiimonas sp. SCSIO 12603]|uniref:OprO/OprP family phosphate-selective porin n=1 Tax=Kordiimonas sp. SCSIO 12603 TaxID=2829596 RepID=UPI002107D1C3|nr:porin [Kordiimonas sp. SCSIO 12603]UTW57925.1 hypothetical protein KFE96_13980 [Kordiimonas sp. SCSIO 12603]
MQFTSIQKLLCSFVVIGTVALPVAANDTDEPTYNLQLRSITDFTHFNTSDLGRSEEDFDFRSVRATLNGRLTSGFEFKLSTEFAGDGITFEDAFLKYQLSDAFSLTVGRHRVPVSLEEQTSIMDISFAERAAFTDAFNLGRAIGVSAAYHQSGFTFTSGIYGEERDIDFSPEVWSYAARSTFGQNRGNTSWLVGAAFWDKSYDDAVNRSYRGQLNANAVSPIISAGLLVTDEEYLGFEGAVQFERFHLAAEYGVQRSTLDNQQPAAKFGGGYAEIGYFLTDHARSVDIKAGKWTSYQDLNHSDLAVQLVARADFLSLNDDAFRFGNQEAYLFGANLYLNRHIRFLLNIAFQEFQTVDAASVDAHTITTRLQLVW